MTSINPQPEPYVPPGKPFKTLQSWLRKEKLLKARVVSIWSNTAYSYQEKGRDYVMVTIVVNPQKQ